MKKEFVLNKEKAINALLYICQVQEGESNMYNLLKIIFFADSDHLIKYGRPITGDTMFSMNYGPVPSFCYDTVKLQGKGQYFNNEQYIIENLIKSDTDVFSESDLECLDNAIKEYGDLSFNALKKRSHTPAYEKTKKEIGLDKPISFLDIAKEDGLVDENMLTYISSRFDY